MRLKLLALTALTVMALPAYAAENADPAMKAWDECVGYNTQDYADMFGIVSIDDEDVTKAIEDCFNEEEAYKAAHPGVPETVISDRKDTLKTKWLAHYAELQKKPHRVANN